MLNRAKKLLIAGVGVLSIAVVLTGCGFQPTSTQQGSAPKINNSAAAPEQTQPPAVRPMSTITVYYADKEANYLVAEVHKIDQNQIGDQPARTAIELLLNGTKNPNLVNVIPPGTKLKGLVVKDGIAYVDFNKKILKYDTGGSAEEVFVVASIVNTLTEFPAIKKVQILIEGQKVATIGGHAKVDEPLSRSEKIIKK